MSTQMSPLKPSVQGMTPTSLTPTITASSKIRILIVDDHTSFTELLTGSLDREPDLCSVGSANGVESGIAACLALSPDVVVMEYYLPDGSGLVAAAAILAHAAHTRIVILTRDPALEVLEQAAAIGVCALLPKDGSLATVLDTLRHARIGVFIVHPSLVSLLSTRRRMRSEEIPFPDLTKRELAVLRLMGEGSDVRANAKTLLSTGHRMRSEEIPFPDLTKRELAVLRLMGEGSDVRANAKTLGISENTCRGYVKSILSKLSAHSQLEAVVVATRLGLVPAQHI